MKAENLRILKEKGFPVPKFIVVESPDEKIINELPDRKYAVRSSSDLEDGEQMSYAGQFHTELNVKKSDISAAVKRVMESGKQYGSHMKVIIQEMVDAEYAGVLFTANPLGILNESVVVIGRGLGENVVEDRCDTTAYYYNLDDDLFYYEQQEDAVLAGNEVIKLLVDTGKRIKEIFQKDMDIEFAVKDAEVYVLQARPITTLSYSRRIVLDNSNIVESYPGISLPMTQSFVKEIYRDIFRAMVRRLTGNEELVKKMEPVFQNMVREANGRVYYDITNWYNVLSILPFSGKIISVWQEMLGVSNKDISVDFKAGFFEKGHVLFSFLKYLHTTPEEMAKLNNRFSELYPGYMERIEGYGRKATEGIRGLLKIYRDIEEELIPLWDITLVNDMYAFIYTYLAGRRHPEEISHIKELESMRPVETLNRIIRLAKKDLEYIKAKQDYIQKYGDRCLEELKLETRTYRTDPELFDEYVRTRISDDIPEETEHKTVESGSFLVKRAKLGIANREISRMNRTRIFGMVRSIMLKIGEILKEQGKISEIRDVFYLTLDELREEAERCSHEPEDRTGIKIDRLHDCTGINSDRFHACPEMIQRNEEFLILIQERKLRYEGFKKIPAYSRLVYGDKVVDKPVCNICTDIARSSEILKGIPSSPGKVKGEVLVIEKADQKLDTRGKIIVTRMTDPGWVFLIKPALGIIAEKGSMLSHTAIITRELGKPSVVNVRDAARVLRTGDMVEIDAYEGTVTRIWRR
ncbi:phosphoenolpyruvate synthase/pyruvate phosphate dikinase [Lachnospiraceae bacterium JC7]|nr:phosphoenolpyruvate synthase/pyruvate phosphate dikinase [Lachnospiraceae bacterium JC7]